jgi:DNA-binding NarL/FixJ family response regulator
MRVLLLEMPQLLRGIFEQAIEARADCELLDLRARSFPMFADTSQSPDVVIVGITDEKDATLLPALFARWPNAQVMTVTLPGEKAAIYELKPIEHAFRHMSPAEIIDTLHRVVHRNRYPLH